MFIITSPSKTMDISSDWTSTTYGTPRFLDKAEMVVNKLKSLSKSKLLKLYGVGEKIIEINQQRFLEWEVSKHTKQTAKPATLLYNGDIFERLDKKTYTKEIQEFTHKNLKILSGLYGVLNGYDLIQPYRLEMKSKLKIGTAANLYEFWKPSITANLNEEIKNSSTKYLLDLASVEYSKAIDLSKLDCKIVKVEFLTRTGLDKRIVPIYAKQARGEMINYICQNLIASPWEIKDFDKMGFRFYNQSESSITFIN